MRTFTRVPIRIVAHLRTDDGTEARGTVEDVSLNGVGILTDVALEPGTTCSLRLLLETGLEPIPMDGTATVVRSRAGKIAVHIDAMDIEAYEHLQKLVLYNSSDAAAIEREAGEHVDEQPRPMAHRDW